MTTRIRSYAFSISAGIVLAASTNTALAQSGATPTFNKEVVRIFQTNCQSCHHPGDIGGFSLMDYASTRPWARSIQQQVLMKTMPPWKPSQGSDVFLGARILAQRDLDTINAWVNAGAPEGDPADLPAQLQFTGGWALGPPDLVLQMAAPFSVPATGNDIYRCFSLPTNLPADTYVSAFQVTPGDRTVVHHVVMYSDPAGLSKQLETVPGQGYPCFGDPGFNPDPSFLAAWAPGARPAFMNAGTAMRIPKNGFMAMQVHYHLDGTATTDQTQVGIYFATGPVDKLVTSLLVWNPNFLIPAGNSHYPVMGSQTISSSSHLVQVFPHMHRLGRESHVSLLSPDGKTTTPLIDINDWDFNWQGFYDYVQPVAVSPNSKIQFTKYYDNSVNNPKNPNSPPVDVGWGEQTTDEMAVAFFGITQDQQHLILPSFTAAGVVNSASYAAGTAAPGAIMSLFGVGLGSNWASAASGPATTLAGLRINIGGVSNPAPLFYASPSQVSFQMPYEASGATTLTLTREDGKTTTVNVNVGDAQPGLFTSDSSGTGPAAATLADSSLLSSANPATRGNVVVLYATGLGSVAPSAITGAGATGPAACVNPVTVTVGGRTVIPDYAGLTPGYPGLYQVNVRIPADLATTGDVPLKVTAAGVDSNSVTLAVR
jgi:uncharacterized protein (TIGR03437 family)